MTRKPIQDPDVAEDEASALTTPICGGRIAVHLEEVGSKRADPVIVIVAD